MWGEGASAFDLGVPGEVVDAAEGVALRKTLPAPDPVPVDDVAPPFQPVKTSTKSLPLNKLTFSPGGNTPRLLADWFAWTLSALANCNAKSVVKLRA